MLKRLLIAIALAMLASQPALAVTYVVLTTTGTPTSAMTGTISGSTLTTSAITFNNSLTTPPVGMFVYGTSVTANTYVTGACTGSSPAFVCPLSQSSTVSVGEAMTTLYGWNAPAGVSTLTNVEAVGAGGGGSAYSTAGGGGGYSAQPSISVTAGTYYPYQVGVGGLGATLNAGDGGASWFNGANLAGSSVGANGSAGATNLGSGQGGGVTGAIGSTKNYGGAGGSGTNAGGGGGGGPNGNGQGGGFNNSASGGGGGGGNGGGSPGSNSSGTTGGNGGNNSSSSGGGAGGTSGVPGGAGTNGGGGGGGGNTQHGGAGGNGIDMAGGASGSGGGGGGPINLPTDGANGGLYGGGGSAAGGGTGAGHVGGNGAGGEIVLTYSPALAVGSSLPLTGVGHFFPSNDNLDAANDDFEPKLPLRARP